MISQKNMKKVLVVEDDETIRMTTIFLLEEAGYHPVGAENGEDALAIIKEVQPDLILCDVMMPLMDGHEFLRQIRGRHDTATVPFIFLTAKNDRTSMRTGMNLGADDYLTKPFTFAELSKAVEAGMAKYERVEESSRKKLDTLRQNVSYALPHEMLTPLNGIIGASELLLEMHETFSPDEIREMLEMVRASGQRLFRLIRNTLLFAQLELARNDAERIAVFRESTTEEIESLLPEVCMRKAKQYNRANDITWSCKNCIISIASEHLQNIIEEIVDNALKFSEPGTPVEVVASSDSSMFTLQVTDHGRGMTAEEIEEIGAFMQFQRKMYEQQGTGLGLAITRQITGLHDGMFAIESVPGKKTTITVTLPLANSATWGMLQ